MSVVSIARKLDRLEALAARRGQRNAGTLRLVRGDPSRILSMGGMEPDAWQAQVLRGLDSRVLLLCSRQAGKSLTAAGLALREALLRPPALVLLLSPTQRQSGELFRDKLLPLWRGLGRPVPAVRETALSLELANGSRLVALPGSEAGVRCFSGVRLLVIDEAARVADTLYRAVRPMLAVSGGRLIALSTPFGKRGWYFDEWHGAGDWKRVRITAEQCPRISAEFLAEERRALGERWYRQEYLTEFSETVDAVFSAADIEAALSDDVKPLFGGRR